MASTRSAVRDPPLFTITSSKGTVGFAAAIPFKQSSSRSIRFQVTSRIETIGSAIETRQSTQLADSPDHLDAVATGRLRWGTAIKITHEGLELASQRRFIPNADRPLPIVGTDFNQSVPGTI